MSIDAAAGRLHEERAKLVHQLGELGATEAGELRSDVDHGDGFADAAAATAERTEVLGVAESLAAILEEVDMALAAVEAGTYGTCSECGVEIDKDRLEFRPWSTRCVPCKAKAG